MGDGRNDGRSEEGRSGHSVGRTEEPGCPLRGLGEVSCLDLPMFGRGRSPVCVQREEFKRVRPTEGFPYPRLGFSGTHYGLGVRPVSTLGGPTVPTSATVTEDTRRWGGLRPLSRGTRVLETGRTPFWVSRWTPGTQRGRGSSEPSGVVTRESKGEGSVFFLLPKYEPLGRRTLPPLPVTGVDRLDVVFL